MDTQATAQALVADTSVADAAQVIDTPEVVEASEDDMLEEIYNKSQADGDAAKPEEPAVAKEAPAAAAPTSPPTDLPSALKEHWDTIPEAARTAITESQRDMGRKLADQGRQVQALAPIRDTLTKAVQELPAFSSMRPDEAATEIFNLAKMSDQLRTNPVQTLANYIKQNGLGQQMAAVLQGQPVTQQNTQGQANEIATLKREIQRLSDPRYLRENFDAFNVETRTEQSVNDFAAKAEHWGAVENHMPAAVQFVQQSLGPNASPQDVLAKAYELAVGQFVPEAKATQEPAAVQAATPADPKRTQAAMNAKSVNIQSQAGGKKRPMTEDEIMEAAWTRLTN